MLRNRIVNGQKATDATYVAHTNLKRGMGVIKGTDGKTAFASGEGDASKIFVVDRDNLPEGIECMYTDRPDTYFDDIKEGSYVLLRPYVVGESFYTDQYEEEVPDGQTVTADNKGMWLAVENSRFVSRGTETVAGVKMLIVEAIY